MRSAPPQVTPFLAGLPETVSKEWYPWFKAVERALASASGVTDGDKGDITVSASGATWIIDADSVTYAKLQNVSAASKLLGRGDSGAGDPEEITLGTGLSMSGVTLNSTADISDGDKGDITVSGSGATWTIDNDVVSFPKMQNIATDRLIGRDTAGAGDPEELTVGGGVEFTGSGGIQRSALSGGDVTAPAGSATLTIANDAVTYAKMQNVSAASKLIGRGDSGSGDPQEITLGAGLTMTGTTLSSSGAGGSTLVRKTADETVASSTAFQDDDELFFAIGANETWQFEIHMGVAGTAAADAKVALAVPAGATGMWGALVPAAGVTAFSGSATIFNYNAFGDANFVTVGTSDDSPTTPNAGGNFHGLVVNGATPGNVQVRWAQQNSSITPVTVVANSYIVATMF